MPKVSVIVPVYGVEKYIERCAHSLFEQTLDDIEYIFVDDCTPDNSIDVLKKVIDRYKERLELEKKHVIIERMPQNSGQAAVREHGIKKSSGDYVIHCDSDDWVDTDMYRAMFERAVLSGADIVICDYNVANENGNTTVHGVLRKGRENIIKDTLALKCSWSVWNKLVKRELYLDNGFIYPEFSMAEDMLLTTQLLVKAQSVDYIDKGFYFYSYNPNSIVNKKNVQSILRNFEQNVDNLNKLESFLATRTEDYSEYIDSIKYRVVSLLNPISQSEEIKRKWLNTFPGLYKKILFNHQLTLKQKIGYYYRFFCTYLTKVKDNAYC